MCIQCRLKTKGHCNIDDTTLNNVIIVSVNALNLEESEAEASNYDQSHIYKAQLTIVTQMAVHKHLVRLKCSVKGIAM